MRSAPKNEDLEITESAKTAMSGSEPDSIAEINHTIIKVLKQSNNTKVDSPKESSSPTLNADGEPDAIAEFEKPDMHTVN